MLIQIHRILLPADGWSRLESESGQKRHAGGDASQDPAVIVGPGFYLPVIVVIKRIIVFGAMKLCRVKSCAKFDAFYGRYAGAR